MPNVSEQLDLAVAELKSLQRDADPEADHARADQILCELLRAFGGGSAVDEWEKIEKWYA